MLVLSTWRFARETRSALVRVHAGDRRNPHASVFEKFLFYRGLGAFGLPLAVRAAGEGRALSLSFENASPHALGSLFLIRVEEGSLRFAALGDLAGGAHQAAAAEDLLGPAYRLDEGVERVKDALTDALAGAGLYCDEARAMVNTWESSYFRTTGLRVLYILPRPLVDEVIPIRIDPVPDDLARVMVGRLEVLTPEREREIELALGALAGEAPGARREAERTLAGLGRLLEPSLRRVLAVTRSESVTRTAEDLLASLAGAGERAAAPGR